jgi:phosphoglycerate dehydrogenase-like enzyme
VAAIVAADYCRDAVFSPAVVNAIRQQAKVVAVQARIDAATGERDFLEDVEVLFTSWGAPRLDAALLQRMPRLQAVFHGAGSIRPLTSDAFWNRGIIVASAYAQNAIPVSEFALAVILLSTKQVWRHLAEARGAGPANAPVFPDSFSCAGNYRSVVGIVSYGAIGSLLRHRLRSFDHEVLVCDPRLTAEMAEQEQVSLVDLKTLFARSDVVSLHTPLLESTSKMIRAEHLAAMKPHATLLNTARGGLIDEAELIAALSLRPDIHAFLDVTDPEPPAADSPLYRMPNILLTPHIAGSVGRECERMGEKMVEEFLRYRGGQALRWSITRAAAEKMT